MRRLLPLSQATALEAWQIQRDSPTSLAHCLEQSENVSMNIIHESGMIKTRNACNHACTRACPCMSAFLRACMNVCMHTCIYACMYSQTYAWIDICIHVCIYCVYQQTRRKKHAHAHVRFLTTTASCGGFDHTQILLFTCLGCSHSSPHAPMHASASPRFSTRKATRVDAAVTVQVVYTHKHSLSHSHA